jgi:hypothetical protein
MTSWLLCSAGSAQPAESLVYPGFNFHGRDWKVLMDVI